MCYNLAQEQDRSLRQDCNRNEWILSNITKYIVVTMYLGRGKYAMPGHNCNTNLCIICNITINTLISVTLDGQGIMPVHAWA